MTFGAIGFEYPTDRQRGTDMTTRQVLVTVEGDDRLPSASDLAGGIEEGLPRAWFEAEGDGYVITSVEPAEEPTADDLGHTHATVSDVVKLLREIGTAFGGDTPVVLSAEDYDGDDNRFVAIDQHIDTVSQQRRARRVLHGFVRAVVDYEANSGPVDNPFGDDCPLRRQGYDHGMAKAAHLTRRVLEDDAI